MTRFIFPNLKTGLSDLYRHRSGQPSGPSRGDAFIERRLEERRRHLSDYRCREFRLRAAAQAAGVGVYDLDYATGSNYWSPELKAIAGLPDDTGDVPLERLAQLIHPDDRERVMRRIRESLDPRGDCRFAEEYRLLRPDGGLRWVKVRGRTFLADRGGEPRALGATGVVIDITERKAVEDALLNQSEELRLALRVGNSGTFRWDPRTGEHRWCDEMLALYGLRRDQFGGRNEDWLAHLLPEDRAAAWAAVERSLTVGEYAADFRIRRVDDDAVRWIRGRGQVFFDGAGVPVRMLGINVDITEHRQAQAVLEENDARMQAILGSLSEGVVIFDLGGQVLNTNPAARKIMGYGTAEEALRRLPEFADTFEVRSPDGTPLPLDEWPIGKVMRGETFTDYDIVLSRKDGGDPRIISHNGSLVRHAGEAILGVLTLRDVTELRQSARALLESERRLAVALEANGSAVWELNVREGVSRGQDLLFTMLGYRPGQFTTLAQWQALVHADDLPGLSATLEEVILGKRNGCRFEVRLRAGDGSWRWILSQAVAAERDAQGRAVRLVGTHTDIDERKRTEEALRRESSRLQGILDNAPALIWIRDLQGRVALANRAFLATVDVPFPERFIGRSVFEVFPKETAGRLWAADQWAMANKAPLSREEDIRHKDGQAHPYLTLTFAVRDIASGLPRSICSISIDITERKVAEAQIQAFNAELEARVGERTAELQKSNEALLQANTELKRFAHATAHDLQTPLRSIVGFAQLLEQEVRGREGRVGEYAQQVVGNARRLHTLIHDLLAYTRLDTDGLPFGPVDLRELFDEVAASLQGLIGETGAEVSCGPLPTLAVDRTQIAQMLQNLVENGIKYNRAHPPRVRVGAELAEDEWLLSVADNGIGIDPRHHERIFEIFGRLHTYHHIPGTGIGLALCRRIVERHGGRIWVESRPGQGSTFYFTLPAAAPPPGRDLGGR